MNIFMPHPSVKQSVKMLDDVRLRKQILECYQLCNLYERLLTDKNIKNGYKNHPIFKYYFIENDGIQFVITYAFMACFEYEYRFEKLHKYSEYFAKLIDCSYDEESFRPAYIAGQKLKGNQIIDNTYNCYALYKIKLVDKWHSDTAKGRPPKWTNRQTPEFYTKLVY